MQILLVIIGLIGIILVIFSIRILFKQIKKKSVTEFPLDSKTNSFDIKNTGQYSICLIGAKLMSDSGKFQAKLKTDKENEINLNKIDLKYRFRHNGQFGLEYWNFNITETGEYNLSFNNLSDLIVRNSMLLTTNFFQKEINTKDLKVIIKEVVPIKYRIIAIISFGVGIFAILWGILLSINPNFFK